MDDAQITSPGAPMWIPKVLIMMSDYGHDPTETAVPYTAFKKASYSVHFATETGKKPECDTKMLKGFTQKLLGATKEVVSMYNVMSKSDEFINPVAWTAPGFTLEPYDLVLLPGGHDKGVRQIIDSSVVHGLLAEYFPQTLRPSRKSVAAVCHGVMVLANTKDADGRSVIRDCVTTALPTRFEQVAYHGTRTFLGDYYKTYGAGSENVEESVTKVLGNPAQFRSTLNPGPFVVEDEKYNYISARYPGDVELMSEEIIKLMESFNRIV